MQLFVAIKPTQAITSSWIDEPGEWRFWLKRIDKNIEIKIYSFLNPCTREKIHQGKLEFSYSFYWSQFAPLPLLAFDQVRDAYGEDGYQTRWYHPFPQASLCELSQGLGK